MPFYCVFNGIMSEGSGRGFAGCLSFVQQPSYFNAVKETCQKEIGCRLYP